MAVEESEQQAIRSLDATYNTWAEDLTVAEVTALRCYQSSERAYELVNGVLRGSVDPDMLDAFEVQLVEEVTAGLRSALGKGSVDFPVIVWRGLRRLEDAFGVRRCDGGSLVGKTRRLQGFVSCSVARSVAVEGFTDPGGPILLRIVVPPAVQAAWLPRVGRSAYDEEYELLLEDDLMVEVTAAEEAGGILILDCEVRR